MKKTMTITITLALAVTCCFTLISVPAAVAGDTADTPIWQIFEVGKAKSVGWVDDWMNPRFAIYRGTDDSKDWVVFDKETRLVWEMEPRTELMNWYVAANVCMNENAGGRMGWRLPTVEELLSAYP
jgi:hypothetical protein